MNLRLIARVLVLFATTCAHPIAVRAQQTVLEPAQLAAYLPLLDEHPAVVRARLVVQAHEKRLEAARITRRPTSAFVQGEEIAVDDIGASNVTVGVEREFTPRAERQAEVTIAEAGLLAARARLQGIQANLASRLERTVIEGIVHQRIARRLAEEDTLLQSATVTLNTRFSVGDARYIDVIRLRTERLRVQADLVDAQTAIMRALLDLRALVGSDAQLPADLGRPLRLPIMTLDPDSLIRSAPVMLVMQAEELHARATVSVARARGARSWNASLGFQRFASDGGGSSFGPAIGMSFTLPQFNRDITRAGVQVAELDSAATRAGSAALLQRLRAAVVMTASQQKAIASRISGVDQQLITAAREERQAALIAYGNGQLTLTELLDFERSLSRSEIQLLESYDSAIEAWYELVQILAGEDVSIAGSGK